jgi:hypothetical protein
LLIKEKEALERELEKIYIEIDFKNRNVLSLDVIQNFTQEIEAKWPPKSKWLTLDIPSENRSF